MLREISVREFMQSPVLTISPKTTISQAYQLMRDNEIRRLPVVEDDQLVGIITINDVREAKASSATSLSIWELNYIWSQLTVKDVMSKKVITINASDVLKDAAQLMLEYKIGGLPVLNDRGDLVGIITETDIFRLVAYKEEVEYS